MCYADGTLLTEKHSCLLHIFYVGEGRYMVTSTTDKQGLC